MKTRKLTVIALALLVLGRAIPAASRQDPRDQLQELVETERSFSRMSEETGIREAFDAFIADDGILFRPRAVLGKKWMQEHPLPPSKTRPLLTWQPIFAAISRAGDLGYTTGPWQYKDNIKDAKASAFGNFMTIWKKQPDGSWKFVLDLGVSNPEPKTRVPILGPVSSSSPRRFRRVNVETARAQLMDAEKEFSGASAQRGAVEAFLAHADRDVRVYRDKHEPFVGKKAALRALTPLKILWTWVPAFADVSVSGDLGYSYGTYQLRDKTAAKVVEEGNYARVWKRINGVWKVVIDVANPLPPEKKN